MERRADFPELLMNAATDVEGQVHHPGQILPGVWVNEPSQPPEVVIGIIAATAVARVSAKMGLGCGQALEAYVRVSRNVGLKIKGDPAKMAAQHLRDAAEALRVEQRVGLSA